MTTTAWFDEQDRLTPEDLLTVTFPVSRLGRRGYEEEPVKHFVRTVHGDAFGFPAATDHSRSEHFGRNSARCGARCWR